MKSNDKPSLNCQLVRAEQSVASKQGLMGAAGISAETVGAKGINMQIVTIPPGVRAKTHMHRGHETAIYALSGRSSVWWGAALEYHDTVGPGDFFYIPAGMPHQPYNDSSEPAVVVISRTDPNDQESVELVPDLDQIHG